MGRVVFRPRRARAVVYFLALALIVSMTWIAVALPTSGPHPWGMGSRVALVLLALAIVYLLHRLAAVRVVTTDDGVEVVNVVRRRKLAWAQIVGVRLSQDDSWLVLDLDDGEAIQAMGVARSEGPVSREQARAFARLVNEHSRTPRND
ncbi:MAG: PH domain-containing protein [Actinomycetes bacterium]